MIIKWWENDFSNYTIKDAPQKKATNKKGDADIRENKSKTKKRKRDESELSDEEEEEVRTDKAKKRKTDFESNSKGKERGNEKLTKSSEHWTI